MQNNFDRAIIISADTDMVPAIKMAKKLKPETQIDVISPPKRRDQSRGLKSILQIGINRIQDNRLKDEYFDGQKTIAKIPNAYRKSPLS